MANCLNLKLPEIQTFQKESGLSDFLMQILVAPFIEKHNRLPHYDEIPRIDTLEYIKTSLNISSKNTFNIEEGLSTYGVSSLEELQILLNNKFSDKNITITGLNETAIIDIKPKPKMGISHEERLKLLDNQEKPDVSINQREILLNYIDEIGSKLGIPIKYLTSKEIIQQGLDKQVVGSVTAKAFVYNGEVFINMSNASTDSKVHELLHIFLGTIKASNPDIYYGLVQSAINFNNLSEYKMSYPNRTQNDFLEEVFVSEFAKYLVNGESEVSNLDKGQLSELQYHVNRMLDTMIDGVLSVKTLGNSVYNNTLSELAEVTFSDKFTNKFMGSMSLDNAVLHRQTANVKEALLKSNDLIEQC